MQQEEVIDPLAQMVHYLANMLDNPLDLETFNNAKKHAGRFNKLLNLQSIMTKLILEDEEYNSKFKNNILTIFNTLILDKNFSFIFKGLLEFIMKNEEKLSLNYQSLIEQNIVVMAKKIRSDCIKLFLNAFKLNEYFNHDDILQWYKELILSSQFDDAFVFYKEMKLDENQFNVLIDNMNTSESCSKAGQFIKKAGFDPQKYPAIIKRQIKSTAYYYYKTFSWYKIEELLIDQPQILMEVCYLLEKNSQCKMAATIIYRQKLNDHIDNPNFLKKYQTIVSDPTFNAIENILFTRDAFIPSDQLENPNVQYLTAQEFGYEQDKVVFVDKEDVNLNFAMENILNSALTGFDTEFVSPMYQLDNSKQELQIVQIATPTHAFLFDLPKLKNSKIVIEFFREYFTNSKISIIGHTVDEDLLLTSKALQLRTSKICSVLDVSTFASKIGDSKQKSLAYISETLLKKPLSKLEQRSRWGGRPLRLAQMHYAAMDAIVCLKIYEILIQKFQPIPFKNIDKLAEQQQIQQE